MSRYSQAYNRMRGLTYSLSKKMRLSHPLDRSTQLVIILTFSKAFEVIIL